MERLGEYLIRRMVGEGGMGKVYEAEERLSRRRVALKVLRPELGRSEDGRQMFLTEMTILAHLDHPNIVRSLACTEVDGELVMVLEYLDGETLRQRLAARGRLAWTEAVAITADVAAGLTAAHGQDPPIVHRDLKPENLMIVAGDRVKVMDFGIGKVLQAIRKSTTHSVGTLQYMSPEQIDAAPIDHRADLYSLGLVLYEMLAGAPPFASESPRELLNLQCTAAPPALPDDVRAQLPRGVERLLVRLLEKAPADRPASADEVVAALEPFVTAWSGADAGSPGHRHGGSGFAVAGVGGASSAALPVAARTAAGSSARLPAVTAVATGAAAVEPAAKAAKAANGANGARAVATPRMDTIALIDRAGAPREITTRGGIAIVIALCAITALIVYAVRAGWIG